ncbi:unnamed protein product, partial [Candidula unifasciata]
MSRNITSACIDQAKDYNVPFGISWITLSTLVIAQSVLILFIIWRTPNLHTNTNIFIVSVTVADILYAASCGINAILNRVFFQHIVTDGILMDTFTMGVTYSTLMLSINQMGVIAAD